MVKSGRQGGLEEVIAKNYEITASYMWYKNTLQWIMASNSSSKT